MVMDEALPHEQDPLLLPLWNMPRTYGTGDWEAQRENAGPGVKPAEG